MLVSFTFIYFGYKDGGHHDGCKDGSKGGGKSGV